jgi:hypothetical protein
VDGATPPSFTFFVNDGLIAGEAVNVSPGRGGRADAALCRRWANSPVPAMGTPETPGGVSSPPSGVAVVTTMPGGGPSSWSSPTSKRT